jgi:hypothetical protein
VTSLFSFPQTDWEKRLVAGKAPIDLHKYDRKINKKRVDLGIDPTVEQFDYINITDFYHLGQRASGSLCYYGFTPGIPLWDCFVPPVTTRKLTRAYKSQTGTAVAMEKWLVEEDWWKANKHQYKMHARQR